MTSTSSAGSPGALDTQPPQRQCRPLQMEETINCPSAAEQALMDAMERSSPLPSPILGKRTHKQEGGDNTEPEEGTSALERAHSQEPSFGNIADATLRYATHKKLRSEQRDEVEAFLQDSALGRQAKLFVCILSIENKIDAYRSAAPPYQVSDELKACITTLSSVFSMLNCSIKTNINNYAIAILLSTNIGAYKGDIPRNHILDILKRYRFDLPPGIEHDYSNWEKITTFVSYSLTQARAKIKKVIRDSIKEDTNVFALAQLIVHGTPCRPTVQLCSRVVLMRTIYRESGGGEKYWNFIDQRLAFIHKTAGSTKKIVRAFRDILKTDRETYGAGENYEIGDVVANEWQQRVDDVVAGASAVVVS